MNAKINLLASWVLSSNDGVSDCYLAPWGQVPIENRWQIRNGFGLTLVYPVGRTGLTSARGQCPVSTCAVTRRRFFFPVGASPTRRPLQPEATGAGMEETKCLKPSDSGYDFGDCASVQAATRVSA